MDKLCDMLQEINEHMRQAGFETDVRAKSNDVQITGKEVIIKMPFVMTLTIPKEGFSGSDQDISRAVSQAISRAVSLNTGA